MKRISLLFSVLVICFAALIHAQTAPPKPDPELQKYRVWLGHWRGVIEYPSGQKVPVEETFEMILGGFFMQARVSWPEFGSHDLWIQGYDPTKRNYPVMWYSGNNGRIRSGTLTVDGNIWTLTSNGPWFSSDGKENLVRITTTFPADSTSRQEKGEVSEDSKTWATFYEYKATKTKPAAKK